MHRLRRVRFAYETHDYSYGARYLPVEVTPAILEACRLDLEDTVKRFGGFALPPEVLCHSHFRRRKGRQYYPPHRLSYPGRWPRKQRQRDRARRRRELMLRDKQRILDRCFTTRQS